MDQSRRRSHNPLAALMRRRSSSNRRHLARPAGAFEGKSPAAGDRERHAAGAWQWHKRACRGYRRLILTKIV
jgi:hypothetical protein